MFGQARSLRQTEKEKAELQQRVRQLESFTADATVDSPPRTVAELTVREREANGRRTAYVAQEQLEKLQAEIDGYKGALTAAEADRERLRSQRDDGQRQLEVLQEKLMETQQGNASMMQKLLEGRKLVEAIQQRCSELEAKAGGETDEAARPTTAPHCNVCATRAAARQKDSPTREAADRGTRERNDDVQLAGDDGDHDDETNAQLQARLKFVRDEWQGLKREVNEMQQQLAMRKSKCQSLKEELKTTKHRATNLAAELESVQHAHQEAVDRHGKELQVV